jgi:hypothetical protein
LAQAGIVSAVALGVGDHPLASALSRFELSLIVMRCSAPVSLSRAETFKMPFASMS